MIDKRLQTRVHVKAGPRMVGVTFQRRNAAESDEPLQPHERDHDLQNMNGLPLIDHVNITGPYNATGPGDTPSRRRIFSCAPGAGAAEEARLRAEDPVDARAPRLSAAGDRRGRAAAGRASTRTAGRRAGSKPASSRACG